MSALGGTSGANSADGLVCSPDGNSNMVQPGRSNLPKVVLCNKRIPVVLKR